MWVLKWVLEDPKCTFEEKVLAKVKRPEDKPLVTRRKVHWKSKVITTEEYLNVLTAPKERKGKASNTSVKRKENDEEGIDSIESETDKEVIEESNDEIEINEEDEGKLVRWWKWLSAPTKE